VAVAAGRRANSSIPEENGDTLDLLFFNPEAVPVLVEAKRGKKRGVSRSAIGQILDYAAAVAQWSEQALRGHFVKTCSQHRVDPEETFRRVFGAQQCQEEVWRQATTNLHQRTVRLLIVADHIPAKLCRIADFLNAEMAATQVVPCELGEYDVAGKRTWVPKVVHGAEVQARLLSNMYRDYIAGSARTMPNQALHMTGTALRFFLLQRLTGGPGK
jgi:hypothetical protein